MHKQQEEAQTRNKGKLGKKKTRNKGKLGSSFTTNNMNNKVKKMTLQNRGYICKLNIQQKFNNHYITN